MDDSASVHNHETELRLRLLRAGFHPLPLFGKAPSMLKNWQERFNTNPNDIAMWAKQWPDAINTGVLCRFMPTLDIDILHPEAIEAIKELVTEQFEERGYVLIRTGKPPKFATPFRTDTPFAKISANLIAPDGSPHKIEFLCDGQQVVVDGIHPDTRRPYTWHGGMPGDIPHEELPYITGAEAQQFVDRIVTDLIERFGFKRPDGERRGNGRDTGATADWGQLTANITTGIDLHNSILKLTGKCIASGMDDGATVNMLRGLMDATPENVARDDRWKDRYRDIPRTVRSTRDKIEQTEAEKHKSAIANLEPWSIDQTLDVFKRWLLLSNLTPVYAVLGAVAANMLPGDAVWLGVIGPPSSAKTEILNSISMLPHVVQAATLTPAGLLSGTPKKQRAVNARGGLLNQIGAFGIISLKDFGSILSMRPDAKPEVLAALREVYDGAWTRILGTDGGRVLTWRGKVGLLFGSTGVIDSHYSVIGAMGDRFLFSRLAPVKEGQFDQALKHMGAATGQMRKELAEAVAHLFAGRRAEPQRITDQEAARIDSIITLVVRLRAAVERDRHTRELEAVYGAEGTARIGLALERLLAGLDTLGVDRATAMDVVEAVAMDSVPPTRRNAYQFLANFPGQPIKTSQVAQALGLPTITVRRSLEELAAYRLIIRRKEVIQTKKGDEKEGQADTWTLADESDW